MTTLELLSQLKALDMAAIIRTPSGHPGVVLYDQPHGSVTDTLLFTDPYLVGHLKARLEDAKEELMLT